MLHNTVPLLILIALLNFVSFFLSLKTRTNHHTNDECQIFKENRELLANIEINATKILLALRLWLTKYRNPSIWERINNMEAHLNKRIDTLVWKENEIDVVNVSFM